MLAIKLSYLVGLIPSKWKHLSLVSQSVHVFPPAHTFAYIFSSERLNCPKQIKDKRKLMFLLKKSF